MIKKKNRTFDIGCIVNWCGKIDKVTFWGAKMLKAKIFSTITVNALISTKKIKILASLVLKKIFYFYFCLCW